MTAADGRPLHLIIIIIVVVILKKVEMTAEMASAATGVVRRNNMHERITVLNCHSRAVHIDGEAGPADADGGADSESQSKHRIVRRADVIVTETVDAGLLGEGIFGSCGLRC